MARDGLAPRGGRVKFTRAGIEVRDLDRAIRFYTRGMGIELLDRHDIPRKRRAPSPRRSRKGSEQVLDLHWYPERRYRAGSEFDRLAFDVQERRPSTS